MMDEVKALRESVERLNGAFEASNTVGGTFVSYSTIVAFVGMSVGLVGILVAWLSMSRISDLQRDVDKLEQRQDLHQVYIEDLTRRAGAK